MENETRYKISEAAKLLGVSISSLRRWERQGVVTPERTPSVDGKPGDRRYTPEHIQELRAAK